MKTWLTVVCAMLLTACAEDEDCNEGPELFVQTGVVA